MNLYRRLYQLRRESPALYCGSYRALDVDGECYAYLREAEGQWRLMVLSFSGEALRVSISGLSTHMDREGETLNLATLELRAYEGLILDT